MTLALDLRLRRQVIGVGTPGAPGPGSDAVVGFPGSSFSSWQFYVRPAFGATFLGFGAGTLLTSAWDNLELILVDNASPFDPANNHVLDTGAGTLGVPGWFAAQTCTLTAGPLRLGVTIETAGGVSVLRYMWFSDAATTETLDLAGFTARSVTYTDPPALYGPLGLGPFLDFYPEFHGTGAGQQSFYDHVEFSAFTANGNALSTPPTLSFKARGDSRTSFYIPYDIGLPFTWRTDVDAIDSDGPAEAADFTYSGSHTCPATVDRTVEQYFTEELTPIGGAHPYAQQLAGAAVLADPWLSAQTIRPYASELAFTLEGNDPQNPAAAAYKTY